MGISVQMGDGSSNTVTPTGPKVDPKILELEARVSRLESALIVAKSGEVTIKSTSSITIDGASAVTIKTMASMILSALGTITIKGAKVDVS